MPLNSILRAQNPPLSACGLSTDHNGGPGGHEITSYLLRRSDSSPD